MQWIFQENFNSKLKKCCKSKRMPEIKFLMKFIKIYCKFFILANLSSQLWLNKVPFSDFFLNCRNKKTLICFGTNENFRMKFWSQNWIPTPNLSLNTRKNHSSLAQQIKVKILIKSNQKNPKQSDYQFQAYNNF